MLRNDDLIQCPAMGAVEIRTFLNFRSLGHVNKYAPFVMVCKATSAVRAYSRPLVASLHGALDVVRGKIKAPPDLTFACRNLFGTHPLRW
jgi:hypothetical protein